MRAGLGDDQLYGGTEDDFLAGGEGDDFLEGNEHNDVLSGGAGQDILLGGSGDDDLWGDGTWEATDTDWTKTRTGALTTLTIAYDYITGGALSTGINGTDFLFGGAGDDMLRGGEGDDFLFGEADSDVLQGGHGNDYLEGGTGADLLVGDYKSGVGVDDAANEGEDILKGGAGDDILEGGFGDDILYGGADNDYLYGGFSSGYDARDGHNYLDGGAGLDYLYGSRGNDFLIGGADSDYLEAGDGDDTFIMEGIDSAYDVFLGGLGYDFILGGSGDDTIRVDQLTSVHSIEAIDGGAGFNTIAGTSGSNTIDLSNTLVSNIDLIDGGAGADSITGSSNADTIIGGSGNDKLNGSSGSDVYVFNVGDGHDTILDMSTSDSSDVDRIEFTGNANFSEAYFFKNSNDLSIVFNNGSDSVTISNFFLSPDYQIEQIQFADGYEFSAATLTEKLADAPDDSQAILATSDEGQDIYGNDNNNYIHGGAGIDALYGGAGDDVIYGGAGNDYILDGEAGNDTLIGGKGDDRLEDRYETDEIYIFNLGDGKDVIYDSGGFDTLQFGEGIKPEDVYVSEDINSNRDLVIGIRNTTDRILLDNYKYDQYYRIEQIKFANGTIWDSTYVLENIEATPATIYLDEIAGTAGNDVIDALQGDDAVMSGDGDDIVYGGEGNDTIQTGNGNDILYGGAGNDNLWGGEGNNTIYGNDGDDYIEANGGDDTINPGAGNDWIQDWGGDDTYLYNQGFGQDLILDFGGYDRLYFGSGISAANIELVDVGGDLGISLQGQDDVVEIKNMLSNDGDNGIEEFIFEDGTYLSRDQIVSMYNGGSVSFNEKPPEVAGSISDQSVSFAVSYTFTLPEGLFIDPNGNETLSYSAAPAFGSALPAWLSFDPVTQTFTGTPLTANSGAMDIVVTASDDVGFRATTTFQITFPDYVEIIGTSGDDVIAADSGNTAIYAGDGNDEIRMGSSSVFASGGSGNDNYVILGNIPGDYFISDSGGSNDVVTFSGYDSNALYSLGLGSLLITMPDGNKIYLDDFDPNDVYGSGSIETFRFSDGVELSYKQFVSQGFDINGEAGNDVLTGTNISDRINGLAGDDTIKSSDGDDTLTGGPGSDVLLGGTGNDTYIFNSGDGHDIIEDSIQSGEINTIQFGTGIKQSDLTVIHDVSGLTIQVGTGNDSISLLNSDPVTGDTAEVIKTLEFSDGSQVALSHLLITDVPGEMIEGTLDHDILTGTSGNDVIFSLAGNDTINAKEGNDVLIGGMGRDVLFGDAGDDIHYGGTGRDSLYGGEGNDLLSGGRGKDFLSDGQGNDLLTGGRGNDYLEIQNGMNTVLYNLGDGQDTLHLGEHVDGLTLSLGKEITLDDISLQHRGDDLLMQFGADNRGYRRRRHRRHGRTCSSQSAIVLSDWYAQEHDEQVPLTLQLWAETNQTTHAAQYDLNAIIQAFDEQNNQSHFSHRGYGRQQRQWQITHAAMDSLLSSSDEEALGGDLAYGYGMKGSIDPFASSTFSTLNDEQFGVSKQPIQMNL